MFLRVCTKFLLSLPLLDSSHCTIYPFSSLICWPHGLLTMFTKDLACGSWSVDLPHDSSIILNDFNPSRHLRGRQVFGLLNSGDFQLHLYCATRNHKHIMAFTVIGIFYLWNFNLSSTHSFYKCLLNTFLVPTIVLVAVKVVTVKKDNISSFVELTN